ncbi:se42 [Alphabaculovirus alterspexiguae]|uniref:Se42 n=1 Tax=Spodoptera exigua multiple nucleopolyhedrovirus TaxID=10454 RepID=A0A3G2JTT0_9ABAC|nr:se42 [Spodoptera exigua multiple nucleopolyhedrovirus]AYN45002.1 se42 [Spodoptera exigua multiple nucleopolyhedrovirus]
MKFSSIAVRRACDSVQCLKIKEELKKTINFEKNYSTRRLFETILLNFDLRTVYILVEECKAIVWALVRTVYARNSNLPSLKKNKHLDFVKTITSVNELNYRLKCLAGDLYKRHFIYELSEDSLSWDEFIQLLYDIDLLWK